MNQDKKVPKLRFPEFSGEWEKHKFSDLVAIERGGSPRPIDKFITKDKTGLNWVKIGDAPKYGNYITQTAEKIRPEGLSKTREVHSGDLILSNSMSFGRPYIMAIDGCIHDGWLAIRDTKNNFDLNFLCTLLGTDCMLNQYKRMAAGSTVNNLNKELVGGTVVPLPNAKEQQKIGSFFANLDSTITHQQRKLESLKKLKKGLLQKMFPRKGQSVPELRFPGFSGEWKDRKFSDLGTVAMCKRVLKEQTSSEGEIPFYKIGTFGGKPDAYISRELFQEYKSKFAYPDVGNMLISASGTIGRIVEYTGKDEYFQDSNIVWFKHDGRIENSFLKCLYSIVKWNGIEGSTIKRLYNDNFLKTEFMLPSVDEQQKIGSFFANLDSAITHQQHKLESLKKLKKGLLQQMFV